MVNGRRNGYSLPVGSLGASFGNLNGGHEFAYDPNLPDLTPGPQNDDIVVTGRRLPPVRISGSLSGVSRSVPIISVPGLASAQYDASNNYCGGTGGPRVPNGAGGASINGACYAHDNCYSSSGTPKATCDARFRRDIIDQCADGKNSRALCSVVGWIYFGFVEDLGFLFYEK